jgi:hypothetical protein
LQRHRLNREAPLLDRRRVGGEDRKHPIREFPQLPVLRGRHRGKQWQTGGERRPERVGKAIPFRLQLAKFVEDNEIATSCDVTLRRLSGGQRAGAV